MRRPGASVDWVAVHQGRAFSPADARCSPSPIAWPSRNSCWRPGTGAGLTEKRQEWLKRVRAWTQEECASNMTLTKGRDERAKSWGSAVGTARTRNLASGRSMSTETWMAVPRRRNVYDDPDRLSVT